MENTPRVIPLEGFPRRAHFEYFAAMANPYVGVTVKVDAGALLHACRAAGTPFSLSVIYCMGRAANAVPQLRQRIFRDEILEYPRCDTSHTVLRPDETYGYCRLNCMQPFAEFCRRPGPATPPPKGAKTWKRTRTKPISCSFRRCPGCITRR